MSFFDDVMDFGGDLLGGVGDAVGGILDFGGNVLGGIGDFAGDLLDSDLGKLAAVGAGLYFGSPMLVEGLAGTTAAEGAMAAGLGEAAAGGAATGLGSTAALSGAATLPETLAMASNFPNMAAIEAGLGTAGYGANAGAAASGLFDAATIGAGAGDAAFALGAPVVDLAGTAVPGLNNPMGAGDISFGQGLKDLFGAYATPKNAMRVGSSLYDMYAKNKMANAQQGYLNQMSNMYAPGSPEARLMEQKIARKDAAAGRNSQYGVRAQNLAAMLAAERAKVMGSPGYSNVLNSQLANRYGGLNSMFAQLGRQAAMSGG